jgi:hypothetical protein
MPFVSCVCFNPQVLLCILDEEESALDISTARQQAPEAAHACAAGGQAGGGWRRQQQQRQHRMEALCSSWSAYSTRQQQQAGAQQQQRQHAAWVWRLLRVGSRGLQAAPGGGVRQAQQAYGGMSRRLGWAGECQGGSRQQQPQRHPQQQACNCGSLHGYGCCQLQVARSVVCTTAHRMRRCHGKGRQGGI